MSLWKNAPASMKIDITSARNKPELILPGMIFIKSRGGAKSGKGHTGIVLGYDAGQMKTVEGNTNDELSGEGDRVGLNIERGRKLTDPELLGFIDPFLDYRADGGFTQKLTQSINSALSTVGIRSDIKSPTADLIPSTGTGTTAPSEPISTTSDTGDKAEPITTIPGASDEEIKSNPIMRNMIMGITKMAVSPIISNLTVVSGESEIKAALEKYAKENGKDIVSVASSIVGALGVLQKKVGLDLDKISSEFGTTPEKLQEIIKVLETISPGASLIQSTGSSSNQPTGNQSINSINQWSPSLNSLAVSKNLTDFNEVVKIVINKLEGGYYHPDMLKDGRVKDSRYGGSGETMYGLDRFAGHGLYYSTPRKGKDPIDDLQYLDSYEYKTPAAKEFWETIDSQNARQTWKWGDKGPAALQPRLLELAGNIIKPEYERLAAKYLTPEALKLVNSDGRLLFNFIYSTWNGSGWFQKFAKAVNDAVASGVTNTDQLVQVALDSRVNSGNSLVAQGGKKIAALVGFA
jgi:hypothetical protein